MRQPDLHPGGHAGDLRRALNAPFEPPSLPPHVLLPLTLVFVCLTFARGADWSMVREPGTVSQLMLDNSVGLTAWGVLLMTGATAFVVSVALRRHLLVWCSHALLFSIYFGIALTTVQAVAKYDAGYAHLVAPLGAVAWHGLLSRLMRPLPRRDRTEDAD